MGSSTVTAKIKNKIKAHSKMKSKFHHIGGDVFIRKTDKGDKIYSREMCDESIKQHLNYTAKSIKHLMRST